MPTDIGRIEKNTGETKAEKYLVSLCQSTFLSMWCYPCIYNDKLLKQRNEGKEICDVFVVFENHIIIFSDKDCSFNGKIDVNLAWKRWVKKALFDSATQINGAERWLRDYPDRVFIDKRCSQKFPIEIDLKKQKLHKVLVTHGIDTYSKEYFRGGYGSLLVDTAIRGRIEHEENPFHVGYIAENNEYIHVLDDFTLPLLLTNLDTISDFVEYLEKKEALISTRIILACGEEDLLGHYLMNERSFALPKENFQLISFEEDIWSDYVRLLNKTTKKKDDEISYFWDELIMKFSKHIINDTQYYMPYHISSKFADLEHGLRELARETRFARRILSQSFLDFMSNNHFPSGEPYTTVRRATRLFFFEDRPERAYVFLTLEKKFERESNFEYRKKRMLLLRACCLIAKIRVPSATTIIGIATEEIDSEERSEDFLVLDAAVWSEEDEAEALKLQAETKLLTTQVMMHTQAVEYQQREKVGRNAPCSCGSGIKYKKCCGKHPSI